MKHKQSQWSFALYIMIAIRGAHSRVPDLENINPPDIKVELGLLQPEPRRFYHNQI